MALDDFDPYAPTPPVTPWASWEDSPWASYGGAPPAAPPDGLQPGIGVPQSLLPPEMPPVEEIQMPPMQMEAAPTIGFPRVPAPGTLEMPAEDPMPAEQLPPMFPGAPEPEVDAISGGTQFHDMPSMPGEQIAPTTHGDQLTDEQRARQYVNSSPEARAASEWADIQARDVETDRRNSAAALDDEQKRLENENTAKTLRMKSRAAMVQLDEDSRKEAQTTIDPWANKGTGQKIAGFIAAVVGGLVQGRTGGRNDGVAMIDAELARETEIQKMNQAGRRAELQRRGASIKQLAEHDEAAIQQIEKSQQVAYARVQNTIKTEMGKYDPASKSTFVLGKMYSGIEDKRQQGLIAFEDRNFKQKLDVLKADADLKKSGADLLKTDAEIAKLNAETAKLRGQGGGGSGAGAANVVQPRDFYTARGLTTPPVDMSEKDYKKWLGLKGGSLEIGKKEEDIAKATRENSPEEQARKFAVGDVTYEDGEPVQFRSEGAAEKVAKLKGSGDMVVTLLDRLMAEGEKNGWSSDYLKSADWRERQADFAQVMLEKKTADELGVIAGPDLDLMHKSVGTSDPTEMRKNLPGLRRGRSNMVLKVNSTIANQVYVPKGKKIKLWSPANVAASPEAKPLVQGKTAIEKGEDAQLGALGKRLSFTTNEERAADAENASTTLTGLDPADDASVLAAIRGAAKGQPDALARLASTARSSNERISNAVLARIKGESPDVYAKVLATLDPEEQKQRKLFDDTIAGFGRPK